MLAQSAEDVPSALARISPAAVEWKLDGARIQVHRLGDEVRAFTRNLADVTDRVPEIVAAIRSLPIEAAVFDAEAIALRPDRRPHPFGLTMSRFGSRSRKDLTEFQTEYPLSAFVFDVLHLDGEDLIDRPAVERFAALDERLPEELRVPRIVTADVEAADRFLDDAIARGHEGVMVKALDAPYEAGRRGAGWIKVKRADHPRPRGPRRRMGSRAPAGTAQQPPPRRARSGDRWVRDAREDVQGHDGRDARVADGAASRRSRPAARASRSTSVRRSWSRSRSTASSRARGIPAASRSGSRA